MSAVTAAPLAPPAPTDTLLSFDFGTRRTGVASGSVLLGRGEPLETVAATGEARLARIDALVREWRPARLLVGVPRHPDGAPNENTERSRRFARQLAQRYRLPVVEVDERYSTVEAHSRGAARDDADAAAAALLLEQYLFELRRSAP